MSTTNNRWIALAILLTAPFLSVIDVFIINIAIPSIQKGVHATDGQIQLVIAGYLLGYAAFLITGGRAGDAFGRKKVFIWGMLLFTFISCICGLAQSANVLNVARFLQGISAAFMVPQTITYIQVLFPEPEKRTKAIGFFGITLGLASVIGQFMGGYFSSLSGAIEGWRFIFFINLPIGILSLYMAKRYLKETVINTSQKFDYAGVGILTTALVCLIYPLIQGREAGWPLWSILAIAGSFGVFWYFITHQKSKFKKGGNPLIHMELFKYKDFNLGLLAVLFFFMVHSSYLLISTVFFQEGLGIKPYQAGLIFVFFGAGFTLSSLLSVRYVIRYGKVVLQWGVLLMIACLLLQYRFFNSDLSRAQIVAVLIMYGFGGGMVMPSLLNMALKSMPVHHAGAAAGVYSTFQQTASALGVSIIGGIFFFFANGHAPNHSFTHAFHYGIIAEIICLVVVGFVLHLLPAPKQSAVTQPLVFAE